MRFKTIFYCLLLILFSACRIENDDQSQVISSAIINGERVNESEDSNVYYSSALVNFGAATCSGTLIASNVVLTAAHCIEEIEEAPFVVFGSFASRSEIVNVNKYFIERIIVHPEYKQDVELNYGNADLALLILKKDVKKPFRPMPILNGYDFLKVGMTVHFAGYGTYSTPLRKNIFDLLTTELNTKYKRTNMDETYSSYLLTRNGLIMDSDLPRAMDDTFYFEQTAGGLCQGDSGGSTLVKMDDKLYLIGVNRAVIGRNVMSGFSDCEYISRSTSVAFYKTWIEEAMKDAQVDKAQFITKSGVFDANEALCADVIDRTSTQYMALYRVNEKSCAQDVSKIKQSLIKLDLECQDKCNKQKGFKGQCQFYAAGMKDLIDFHNSKCAEL